MAHREIHHVAEEPVEPAIGTEAARHLALVGGLVLFVGLISYRIWIEDAAEGLVAETLERAED